MHELVDLVAVVPLSQLVSNDNNFSSVPSPTAGSVAGTNYPIKLAFELPFRVLGQSITYHLT